MNKTRALRFLWITGLLILQTCKTPIDKAPDFAKEPTVSLDIEQIQKRGYLRAILDNNSTSFFIYKGTSMGYEYELLKRLADYLKVELKIKVISGVEEGINALNTGEGDVLAVPLTITTNSPIAFTRALTSDSVPNKNSS